MTAIFSVLRAAGSAVVVVPSPLAGEGRNEAQRMVVGEGCRLIDGLHPSPISAWWNPRLALSRKGRGRNNARFARGETLR
jgi:hypothetical protein